jgi:ATP-dependent RNA helicase DeaD
MSTAEGEATPPRTDYQSNRRFGDFPLSREVLLGIADRGYVSATGVQAASIEPALAGRPMVVRAKTGTGKTAAFCIPLAERVAVGARSPSVLVLAPTRELAQQTGEEAAVLLSHKDVTVAVLVGGLAIGDQTDALSAGAAFIVGTPGRVLDHLRRGNLDTSDITAVVLDEADEMLSMGFFEDVTRVLDALPKGLQVLLFSATLSPDTRKLIDRYMVDPLEIMLSTDADRVEGIEHHLYEVAPGQHKMRALIGIIDIEDPASAIIFCNTREDAATVAAFLDRQGLDAQLISGELPQTRRSAVMKAVKRGEVRFLVATDVAARGIDISDLSHVINYSLPEDPAVYLHRTGRTGRIGKKGLAISLFSASAMGTRAALESVHGIPLIERALPPEERLVELRVDRQARMIRDAMGNLVFETFMPTVRALIARPDGEALLAAALRAFFQWDRTRRARISAPEADDGATAEPTSERPAREPRRGRDDGPRGRRGDDDRKRAPRTEPTIESLDALLGVEDAPAAPAEAATSTPAVQPPADEAAKKKRRRRKRKKKGPMDGDASSVAGAASADDDDAAPDDVTLDDVMLDDAAPDDDALMVDATPPESLDDLDHLLSTD